VHSPRVGTIESGSARDATAPEAATAATSRRARPNARGRAGGKHARQEQQKQDSRQRILEATKTVLADMPYASMAVEDVIAEAQVSRTTFYRHFDGKFAIFKELHRPFLAALYDVYDGLGRRPDPTVEQIGDWVRAFLDFYRTEIILVRAFWNIYSIEPDFNPIAEHITETICQRLAATLPAFRRSVDEDGDAMAAKIEAHLLLQDIHSFAIEAVVRQWNLDTEMAIAILARRIEAFLRGYGA
jgi:AcrR family transcriptional regulator